MTDKHYCQVPGCHRFAARAVEIDLPDVWEATKHYRTLALVAGFCQNHGRDVERRVTAILETRSNLVSLLVTIEAAILAERGFARAGGPA